MNVLNTEVQGFNNEYDRLYKEYRSGEITKKEWHDAIRILASNDGSVENLAYAVDFVETRFVFQSKSTGRYWIWLNCAVNEFGLISELSVLKDERNKFALSRVKKESDYNGIIKYLFSISKLQYTDTVKILEESGLIRGKPLL